MLQPITNKKIWNILKKTNATYFQMREVMSGILGSFNVVYTKYSWKSPRRQRGLSKKYLTLSKNINKMALKLTFGKCTPKNKIRKCSNLLWNLSAYYSFNYYYNFVRRNVENIILQATFECHDLPHYLFLELRATLSPANSLAKIPHHNNDQQTKLNQKWTALINLFSIKYLL